MKDEKSPEKISITCPSCSAVFLRSTSKEKERPLLFCSYCGTNFTKKDGLLPKEEVNKLFYSITLKGEKAPKDNEVLFSIGKFQILKSLGKGGMGEVFLAYDTICGRKVALKRIRGDLIAHNTLQKRFLREARITSQLTHPTIVPIYSIHPEENLIYYTMPFEEGETLREILKAAKAHELKREGVAHPHTSIPSLIRIFLQVCQACAYAHAQGILHRDLKPENFIVGKYGQVVILDWGLAKAIEDSEEDEIEKESTELTDQNVTRAGKVVGTIAYMAPERALGKPASTQTDIYALGVILYQILTLRMPFYRKSIQAFKKNVHKELLIAPELVAPYREVPLILSEIVKKCLAKDTKERYKSIDELVVDIENYIEGKSQWFLSKELQLERKKDWKFQENVLLADHVAITSALELADWVTLSFSKDSFSDTVKVETKVIIGEKGRGIGILFSHPNALERGRIKEGYYLWLASDLELQRKTKLLRSSVTVFEAPEIVLQRKKEYKIQIEKVDRHIHLIIDDVLQFSYLSHVPVVGQYIGILTKDHDFTLSPIQIFSGSQNITVGCLAIPDAFLANKNYDLALNEYRRIGRAFPGRAEGRDALFRAGITLLEKAKATGNDALLDDAYMQFEKLEKTPGAPLSLLGKALIYAHKKEYTEEVKCFELGLRKYKRHPLLHILEEEISFRIHESAREDRSSAYAFILLGLRFLPHMIKSPSMVRLLKGLEHHWERPWFMLHKHNELSKESLLIHLAFWLGKTHILEECIRELITYPQIPFDLVADALFSLFELGAIDEAKALLATIKETLSPQEIKKLQPTLLPFFYISSPSIKDGLHYALNNLNEEKERLLTALIRRAIDEKCFDVVLQMYDHIAHIDNHYTLSLLLEGLIYNGKEELAYEIFNRKKPILAPSPLFFYNLYFSKNRDKAAYKNHLENVLETPYPQSTMCSTHYLKGTLHIDSAVFKERTFMWERRLLYRHLSLLAFQVHDEEKVEAYTLLARSERCPLS